MHMCKGSAHFKYMSARRLLTGTAAIFLRSSSAENYIELKEQLLLQFKRNVTSYDVHDALRKRRRLPNENIISYMLSMKEIAAQAYLDDSEVINAIIEGLSDRSAHTSMLYTSKNFEDLQRLLLIYDKRRPLMNIAERKEIPMREARCFNCSKSGHISSQCSQPKRIQGSCFICNSRDHQIKNCPKKTSGGTVHAVGDQHDDVYSIEHNQKWQPR